MRQMKHVSAIKLLALFACIGWQLGCRNSYSVHFEFDNFRVEYEYKDIMTNQFEIKRTVTVSELEGQQTTSIQLLPDIENLDDARFFVADSIVVGRVEYGKTLIIDDPFAFALINLKTLENIYNSHGEDGVRSNIKYLSEKDCIGKVRDFKFSKGQCEIDF